METVEMAREKWIAARNRLFSIAGELENVPVYAEWEKAKIKARIAHNKIACGRFNKEESDAAKKLELELYEEVKKLPLYAEYLKARKIEHDAQYALHIARKSA